MRLSTCVRVNMHAPQWMTRLYCVRSAGKSLPETWSMCSWLPNFFRNRAGSFTLPMSSCCGVCEQASAMSIRASGCKLSSVLAPWMKVFTSPFWQACRMENEVRGVLAGVRFTTCAKTCESVMMSAGGVFRFCRQCVRFCGVVHRALHPLSRRWRMVWRSKHCSWNS